MVWKLVLRSEYFQDAPLLCDVFTVRFTFVTIVHFETGMCRSVLKYQYHQYQKFMVHYRILKSKYRCYDAVILGKVYNLQATQWKIY